MNESAMQQGPRFIPVLLKPRDLSGFERIVRGLEAWRNHGHEDHLIMSRHEVIEIIESIRQLERKK